MNVMVLGGMGFLGQHLCEALLKKGHKIWIVNRDIASMDYKKDVQYIDMDFRSIDDYTEILKDIDIVFHLLSTTVPSNKENTYGQDISLNVIPTINLLNSIVKSNVKKVIFLSSGGTVYGVPGITPIPETHATNPISAYGIQKLTIEKFLYLYNVQFDLDYNIVRLANPFGEGQNGRKGQGIIPIFTQRILNDEEILIFGDGLNVRDYIYITDVMDALIKIMEYHGEHKVFNVGSGVGKTVLEVAEEISQVLNKKFKIKYLPDRGIDVRTNILDISRANQVLLWKPKVDFRKGINKMLTS